MGTFTSLLSLAASVLCIFIISSPEAVAAGRTVSMDNYGDCEDKEGFSLADEEITLVHVGSDIPHERLNCILSFKARENRGVCIYFNDFSIQDCGVTMKIFKKSTASGEYWRRIKCMEDTPPTMCTSERYVTIKLEKENMNQNRNYHFNLLIKESEDSISEKSVVFVSIGIYIAIIIGVISLIAGVAVLIMCCCCQKYRQRDGYKPTPSATSLPAYCNTSIMLQPTAPPAFENPDIVTAAAYHTNLYPVIPVYHQEGPPPYQLPPPPYSAEPPLIRT